MGALPASEIPDLTPIERALAREDPAAARAALLVALQSRTDPLAVLALRVLIQSPFAPDAMAATVDRLLTLVRIQEAQIRALRALIETRL